MPPCTDSDATCVKNYRQDIYGNPDLVEQSSYAAGCGINIKAASLKAVSMYNKPFLDSPMMSAFEKTMCRRQAKPNDRCVHFPEVGDLILFS